MRHQSIYYGKYKHFLFTWNKQYPRTASRKLLALLRVKGKYNLAIRNKVQTQYIKL